MNTVNPLQQIADQHRQLRFLLERFEANQDLLLSSELSTELLSRLIELLTYHYRTESDLIHLVIPSIDDVQAHTLHSSDVLTQFTDLEYELMKRNGHCAARIADVLPQMRSWIVDHEKLDVHTALLCN